MKAKTATVKKCPICSAQLQATRTKEEYYSYFPKDGWMKVGDEVSMRFYCDNDCDLEEDDCPKFD